MKKFFLAAAMLCGVVASAESDVEYAVLYWQIGGAPTESAQSGAHAGRLYWKENAESAEKKYLGGYSTERGAGTGVITETDLVGEATILGDSALGGLYFFELLSNVDSVESVYTSMGWTYEDFRSAGALREGFTDISKAEVTPNGVATAWTVVPEPSSGLLLLVGLGALALRRRRVSL